MSWIDDVVSHSSVAQKVAYAGEVEFLKAAEDDSAGRTVRLRLIQDPGAAHPFSKFTRKRRAQLGTRFHVAFAQIDGPHETMLEMALLNWASNPQGQNVTLQLNSEAERHPFIWCKRGSKDASGTRWMITAVEIDDSEQLIEQERRERAERAERTGNRQTLSNVARLLTKNPTFWRWITEIDGVEFLEGTGIHTAEKANTEKADTWLKQTLGISSKSDLDGDGPETTQKVVMFHKLRNRFVDWQADQGITE